jgi:hypothetical protein
LVTLNGREYEMTNDESKPLLKIGERVKIRGTNFNKPSRVIGYVGPFGPGGARIYRVRYRGKPYPAYAEFREDQLEVVEKKDESPA